MDASNDTHVIKYFTRNLKRIDKDYTVIDSEADGCDQYGIKYWIECHNGWSGRSWNLREVINKSVDSLFKNIENNGFQYKGTTYYYTKNSISNMRTNLITLINY
jgi:hypothetical protein